MFAELNNLLDISDKCPPTGSNILITESRTDGTFLLHHLVSLYLKGGHNVCLVGLGQTFNHYANVSKKLGLNLQNLKDGGKLVFVEGLKSFGGELVQMIGKDGASVGKPDLDAMSCMHPERSLFTTNKSSSFAKDFYTMIAKSLTSISSWNSEPTVLLIDDLSLLLDIGACPLDIISATHYLHQLLSPNGDSLGTVVNFLHIDSEQDEDIELVHKYLQHHSNIQLQVTGLPTGYSREVHGQLHIKWLDLPQSDPSKAKSKTVQYKVTDKNVTFFAIGMSSAVL